MARLAAQCLFPPRLRLGCGWHVGSGKFRCVAEIKDQAAAADHERKRENHNQQPEARSHTRLLALQASHFQR